MKTFSKYWLLKCNYGKLMTAGHKMGTSEAEKKSSLQTGVEHGMNLLQHSTKMRKHGCFLICCIVTYCGLITDLSSAQREGNRSLT